VATAPSGGTLDESMNVPTGGLPISGGALRAVTGPVLTAPTGRTGAPPLAR
jgi:hypothetical protein